MGEVRLFEYCRIVNLRFFQEGAFLTDAVEVKE